MDGFFFFFRLLIVFFFLHIQYNSISLGLTVGAVAAILSRHEIVGSVLFSLALNHKQVGKAFVVIFNLCSSWVYCYIPDSFHLLGRSGSLYISGMIDNYISIHMMKLTSFLLSWMNSPDLFFIL